MKKLQLIGLAFIITFSLFNEDSGYAQNISTIAGTGAGGYNGDGIAATTANLNAPPGVALDAFNNLYIADNANNRVRKVNASTGIITTLAGNGVAGYSGDGGPATSAELNSPYGVALDNSGNIYFADQNNNRIRKVTVSTGIITTVAGNGYLPGGYSGDGGQATDAELFYPVQVVLDASGNIYIDDADNNRIRKVTASTGIITTVAGNGFGSPLSGGFSGDGGQATAAELYFPEGVALDASGNIYIADQTNDRVRKVTISSGIITTVAGNGFGSPGLGGFSGDGGPATAAELHSPDAVAFDTTGNLYISDEQNDRIREVTVSTGVINTVAGNGYNSPASGGYSGDGGPATNAELYYPRDIKIDHSGDMYIADDYNYRIRKVTVIICNVATTISAVNPLCYDTNNGAAVVKVLSGTVPYAYQWSNGQTASNASGLSAGTYTCKITDYNGCIVTDSVKIIQPTKINSSLSFTPVRCGKPGNAVVTANGGTGNLTYSWAPGGGTNTAAIGLSAGTYTCTITDSNGCTQAQIATIDSTGPLITISPNETIYKGDSVSIAATGGGTYSWTPTEGLSCTSCPDPKASPSQTTEYCVSITDTTGCTGTACLSINVEILCNEVFIPNAFSPNNDGQNDVLYVHGNCIKSMDFIVCDRWGNKVFESVNVNNGWNGFYKGQQMNAGTYVYFLKANMMDGSTIDKHGNITLVR